MTGAARLLLLLVCIAIVAIGFGIAVATWDQRTPTWGPRILRGTAVTVAVTSLALAAIHSVAGALTHLP